MKTRFGILIALFAVACVTGISQTLRERIGPQMIFLGGSARSVGMGDAIIAILDDFSGYGSNPATLGFMKRSQAEYSAEHVQEGIMLQHLGGMFKVTSVEAIAVNFDFLHYGGYKYFSDELTRKRGFESRGGLSYGRMISEYFAMGLTLQALNSTTDINTSWGVIGDLGVTYSPSKYVRYGLMVRGLGSDFKVQQPILEADINSARVSKTIALGVLLDFPFDEGWQRVIVGAQNEKILARDFILYRFGLEYQIVFVPGFKGAVRGGGIIWGNEFEPRAGFGLSFTPIELDYGYRYNKLIGQSAHLVTMTVYWH